MAQDTSEPTAKDNTDGGQATEDLVGHDGVLTEEEVGRLEAAPVECLEHGRAGPAFRLTHGPMLAGVGS